MVERGVYEHYMGGLYRVLGCALHSETMEELVVYEALYTTEKKLWVRPLALFLGEVEIAGKVVPRFKKLQ